MTCTKINELASGVVVGAEKVEAWDDGGYSDMFAAGVEKSDVVAHFD